MEITLAINKILKWETVKDDKNVTVSHLINISNQPNVLSVKLQHKTYTKKDLTKKKSIKEKDVADFINQNVPYNWVISSKDNDDNFLKIITSARQEMFKETQRFIGNKFLVNPKNPRFLAFQIYFPEVEIIMNDYVDQNIFYIIYADELGRKPLI